MVPEHDSRLLISPFTNFLSKSFLFFWRKYYLSIKKYNSWTVTIVSRSGNLECKLISYPITVNGRNISNISHKIFNVSCHTWNLLFGARILSVMEWNTSWELLSMIILDNFIEPLGWSLQESLRSSVRIRHDWTSSNGLPLR